MARPRSLCAMRLAIVLPILLLLVTGCRALVPLQPWAGGETGDQGILGLVDDRVRSLMRSDHIPGLSIAVVDDQTTVVLRGYGYADREMGIPATAGTVYRAYSVAKVFTALETMRLVDDGLIGLDAPLDSLLSEWPQLRRWEPSDAVSVRHVLAHRGGLPRNSNYNGSLAEVGPDALRVQVQWLADAWAAYPAGFRYKYSNIGFNVLGRIIETMRGEPFAEHMTFRVFPALGMESSTFVLAFLPPTAVVATGYEYFQSRYYPHAPWDILQLASGNLYTSVVDLADFFKRLFTAFETPTDGLPLPQTLQAMAEPQFARPDDPQRNGLGWMTSEEALSELMIWHQGGDYDANSLIALLPGSGLAVALLTNAGSYDGSALVELAVELFGALLEERGTSVPADTAVPDAATESAAELAAYAGRYIAWGEVLQIIWSGDGLRARLGPATLRLDPAGYTESGIAFAPHHWLETLHLAGLLPVDLDPVRIVLPPVVDGMADHIIVSVSDLTYEICPRYPVQDTVPDEWLAMSGVYEGCTITTQDGMLHMSGVGYLAEREPGVFVVMGGPFAAETVTYDPDSRSVHHQGRVYPRALSSASQP